MTEPLHDDKLIARIKAVAGEECQHLTIIKHDFTVQIPAVQLRDVVKLLLNTFEIDHLSAITAQQRKTSLAEIEVMYHFWKRKGYSLLMTIPAAAPQLDSITDLIPGADFYEREAAEMFGITFLGREATPPLLLPDDWDQKPPLLEEEQHG